MEIGAFLKAISQVNSTWSVAAFSIAALLAVLRLISTKAAGLANSIVWGIVVAICFLGGLPIIARTYLEHERNTILTVYRVRILVLNPDGIPTPGASLHTTASNETTTTSDGTGEVAIYMQTMPADGKVTIYADLSSEKWHGHSDVQLGNDPNPSVAIHLVPEERATVSGLIEDDARHAVLGATVSIVGGASTQTGPDGTFTLKTNAAAGQQVRVHVEKFGYIAINQDHPAGGGPVTITIDRAPPTGRHPKRT
jgi:hypothetical protein